MRGADEASSVQSIIKQNYNLVYTLNEQNWIFSQWNDK